jgi:hypothetical protein
MLALGQLAKRKGVALVAVLALAVLLCLASCRDPRDVPHCFDSQVGDQYVVTLVEPYDTQSQYSGGQNEPTTCGDAFGLKAGLTLNVVVQWFDGAHGCQSGIVTVGDFGGWHLQLVHTSSADGNAAFEGWYAATKGACGGDVVLRIESDAIPSSPLQPGLRPPAKMTFYFYLRGGADASTCPEYCYAEYVVNVQTR